ncbi:putative bifunctional diguanylate cyclase/phosphodiesterase [Dongia soli]|uniref:EAL domain-containing protein n=1 Tax=Dongia soli TaxID=600628 RepID=A0ABU5E8P3_9PROT|nr:EAL domain-containing protein [Dongia soli]MDY0882732.1 EAL domain-containing protein [Dongia soli]
MAQERILIADDTGDLAGLADELRNAGKGVLSVGDAEEAVSRLDDAVPTIDLLLLNGSRSIDAIALLRRLRSTERHTDLAIIVALPANADERMADAFMSGANDCISFPLSLKVAIARLQQVMRHHGAIIDGQEQRERFDLVVVGSGDGIWDWRLDRDNLYFSPRLLELLGRSEEQRPNSIDQWIDLVHPEDREMVKHDLRNHLEGISLSFRVECRMQHRNHAYRWFLIRGASQHDEFGKVIRVAGSFTDISERKLTDPMTGLPNRLVLYDRISQAILRSRRRGEKFGIIMLQSDRYEVMRAAYGQEFCDQAQKYIAQRISQSLRTTDTLTAISENTMCVLVDAMRDDSDLLRVARRLRAAAEEPMTLNQETLMMTLSLGMAEGRPEHQNAEELLKEAMAALNTARLQGSGQEAIFDPDSQQRSKERLRLEADLHLALRRDELRVHYQPIINFADGRLAGFEALLRWVHPTRGVISPADFIPMAEQTGLIVPVGAWVLQNAARQIREWIDEGAPENLFVSVNVSSRQLEGGDLAGIVQQVLAEYRLSPVSLRLELTESAIMQDVSAARELLGKLRDIGCGLLLDDFGTGYSSLSLLQGLPIDVLKIDQSFIRSMRGDRGGIRMVEAIVHLARLFDLKVVAEGIEDERDERLARACGCDFGQGWLFGKPRLAADCSDLLHPPLAAVGG